MMPNLSLGIQDCLWRQAPALAGDKLLYPSRQQRCLL